MASVSTYLNFMGTTEEAFNFYAGVFGTEFSVPIMRIGDMPPMPDAPPLAEADKNLVMHVELPILAGHRLMATDMVASMGHQLVVQFLGVVITLLWSGGMSLVAFHIVRATIGLRVDHDAEREGLDISAHGESAYEL